MSDDRAAIDALSAAFFAAFDNRHGARPDMAALRALFVPGAIVTKGAGGATVVMDVETFIAPREALLTGGRLTAFHEWETAAVTAFHGAVAVRRCTYSKHGLMDGAETYGEGVKAMTCVRTDAGWRIASVAWQDDEDGLGAGAGFLT